MLNNSNSCRVSSINKVRFQRFFFILFLLFSPKLLSSIEDYIYGTRQPNYSNYGTIGLIQMPSARFFEAGTIGFNWASSDP